MGVKVITPPSTEPITIEELRAHLRVSGTSEDALIMGYLSAAREHAELFTGLALAPQTWEVALDSYPDGAIELPGGAVIAIVSVAYIDSDGATQISDPASYALDDYSTPNWLLTADGTSWPATYSAANAVKVRYQVGAGPLPASIRAALLLITGHLYENREDVSTMQTYSLPNGARALLQFHRTGMGV